MSDISTAIHEAGHAVMLLSLGIVPHEIVVRDDGGGHVGYGNLTQRQAMLAAMAGGVAVEQFLGVPDTDSDEDRAIAEPGLRAAVLSGVAWRQARAVHDEVWGRVFMLEQPILALANVLLARGSLNRKELGEVCRSEPDLVQFADLFPPPASPSPPRQRLASGRHSPASRSQSPLPPGFSFRALDRASSSARGL